MKHKLVVRPEARAELAEAADWYGSKSAAVARGFRAAIRETMTRIAERPKSATQILPGVRRALTAHFPYAIFYAEENDTVVILSIKHQAQDPASWPARL